MHSYFFFFTWRKSARTPGHCGRGGERRGSTGLQPTKTSTMTGCDRKRPENRRERRTGPLPRTKMHRLRSHRARQSGSPTGLPGGPEALIYQHLTFTLTGGSGGPGAPCPSVSAASAAPPPLDPFGVGALHPHSLRCLLPKHNLLTEGGHGPPPSLTRQQCFENRRRREAHPISMAASTPDSIPAYAAPNPRSHRNGGNAQSPFF